MQTESNSNYQLSGIIPLPPSPPFSPASYHPPTSKFSCVSSLVPFNRLREKGSPASCPWLASPLTQKPSAAILFQAIISGIFALPLFASVFLLVFKHTQVPINSPKCLPSLDYSLKPQSHLFPSFHTQIYPKNHLCLLTDTTS